MKTYKFDSLYTSDGWMDNAYITTCENGKILQVSTLRPKMDGNITIYRAG